MEAILLELAKLCLSLIFAVKYLLPRLLSLTVILDSQTDARF